MPSRCQLACILVSSSAVAVAAPSGGCHTAIPGEPCYDKVKWVMKEGIYAHPERYPGLDVTSSFEEFQQVVAADPASLCPAPCKLTYFVSRQVEYRSMKKKYLIKGIAYKPSLEMVHGRGVANEDCTSEQMAVMWASWGRGDLVRIRSLGANTIRLYGNDLRINKRAFLDEAYRNQLNVIIGISDSPYLQASDSWSRTDFDCFRSVYESYRQNLENGMTINGKTAYHPAVKAIILLNEPELKSKYATSDCKAVVSALDAILQAENDLGVVGNPVAFSVAYSLAARFGQAATGSMENLHRCFMTPAGMANYTPKNDVTNAYLTRWVHSFNTPTTVQMQRSILARYGKSECWRPDNNIHIPLFIGEYHSLAAIQIVDLPAMFKYATSAQYPFFLGYCFFEFQKRYDSAQHAALDLGFGLYSPNKNCKMADIEVAGEMFPIYDVATGSSLEEALVSAFGGSVPTHTCRRLTALSLNSNIREQADAPYSSNQDALNRTIRDDEAMLPQLPSRMDCRTVTVRERCYDVVKWAKQEDIYAHPETYRGLSPSSTFEDFQEFFFMESRRFHCPRPCAASSQTALKDGFRHLGAEENNDADPVWDDRFNNNDADVAEMDLSESDLSMSPEAELGVHDWRGPLAQAAALDFEQHATEESLAETLSREELHRYKARFLAAARSKALSMDISDTTDVVAHLTKWKATLQDAFVDEMPVVTEKLTERVNRAGIGWTAGGEEWVKDFSMRDAKLLMGFVHDPEIENTTLEHFSDEIRRLQSFPANFDSRKQWPQCAETIGHVRDQGRCGSCWAQATAGAIDGRLCISSGGQFAGANAWTSAGYITMCYNMPIINGCSGGNPGWALTRMRKTFIPNLGGAPTGGEHGLTCVPYFGSGDALSHFDGKNMKAPKCPGQCTGTYPRSLNQDKIYASSTPSVSSSLDDAKRAVMEAGPIPIAFTVFQDFMAYESGYYVRTTDKQMGGHATTMIGWENYEYILSTNSWGTKWGQNGLFKMQASCCGVSFFISQVSGKQSALPLPHGPSDATKYAQDTNAHRRRRGTGLFAKLRSSIKEGIRKQNPFRHHDVMGGENWTMDEVASELELERQWLEDPEEITASIDAAQVAHVHVRLEVSGGGCAGLDPSVRTRAENAAALAIVGKLSMLIPDGVVQDSYGNVQHVLVLPCKHGDIAIPRADLWECVGTEVVRNFTTVLFVVALPGNGVGDIDLVRDKLGQSTHAIERRLQEAIGGRPLVERQCFALELSESIELAQQGITGLRGQSTALKGESASTNMFLFWWVIAPCALAVGLAYAKGSMALSSSEESDVDDNSASEGSRDPLVLPRNLAE